jgi:hypothetical protein
VDVQAAAVVWSACDKKVKEAASHVLVDRAVGMAPAARGADGDFRAIGGAEALVIVAGEQRRFFAAVSLLTQSLLTQSLAVQPLIYLSTSIILILIRLQSF